MKRPMLILFAVLFFVVSANSQHVLIVPSVEKTVAGNQYGLQLSIENKMQWSFGGFYQASWQPGETGMQFTNPFYGIIVNAPLVKSDRINFYFNTRLGLVNDQFFVVVPGFDTRLKLSSCLSFSIGSSLRMTYPSASARIIISI
jgi:hypothetical protein